jgi:hypothetical protein
MPIAHDIADQLLHMNRGITVCRRSIPISALMTLVPCIKHLEVLVLGTVRTRLERTSVDITCCWKEPTQDSSDLLHA